MSFAKNYKLKFSIAVIATVLLAVAAAADPYILMYTINEFTASKDINQLLDNTLLLIAVLLLQVLLQFAFIYYANWVGQHIIRDIRAKTFRKIMGFKMAYFDTTSVGKLVTRVVSDIETIANFFTQGVFMIVSDILKMLVVAVLMVVINWKLALISLAVLLY